MAKRVKPPKTAAVRLLDKHRIPFTVWLYDYVDNGGAERAWTELGLAEESVIKTLVMETDNGTPLLILMHGNKKVSTKELARELGCKSIEPCSSERVLKLTGYQIGGTSPFGTRHQLTVYAEQSIHDLDEIFINGGHRGFLVGISTEDMERVLNPIYVNVSL